MEKYKYISYYGTTHTNNSASTKCGDAGYCYETTLGAGTLVIGLFAFKRVSKTQLAIAILQFASSWLIIGYIWSIIWAILALLKSAPSTGPNPSTDPQIFNNPWENVPDS